MERLLTGKQTKLVILSGVKFYFEFCWFFLMIYFAQKSTRNVYF